jgi:predicted nuclease with TOPRIM domain
MAIRDKIYNLLALEDETERENVVNEIEQAHNDLEKERDDFKIKFETSQEEKENMRLENERLTNDLNIYKDRVRLLTGTGTVEGAIVQQLQKATEPDNEEPFFTYDKKGDEY